MLSLALRRSTILRQPATSRIARHHVNMSSYDGAKRFFSSPEFAVAGASDNKAKFGYKILAWYVSQGLPVTPLNPRTASINADGKDLACVKSVKDLKNPAQTSLSIVTAPPITKQILQDAKEVGIKAVWLQPGTYDEEILNYARTEFEAGIGGMDGGMGSEGWCVLVDGESAMQGAPRL